MNVANALILLSSLFMVYKGIGGRWSNGTTKVAAEGEGIPAELTGADGGKHADGAAPCCKFGTQK